MRPPKPHSCALRRKLQESDRRVSRAMTVGTKKAASDFSHHAAQLPVLSEKGQERLRQARVHISGTGRIGSSLAIHLASAGVGRISGNDHQNVEPEDLGSWTFARPSDLGEEKVYVLAKFFNGRPQC